MLANERRAATLGAEPIAFIEDHLLVATEPERLFEAPAEAIDKLLCRAGLTLDDIDLIEVNEAFSSQVVANGRVLGWDWDRVNVRGGAVALGHPIGASGARILGHPALLPHGEGPQDRNSRGLPRRRRRGGHARQHPLTRRRLPVLFSS